MPKTKVKSFRGSTVTITAEAEVLFREGTDLVNWKNRFSRKVSALAAKHAPVHGQTGRWAGKRTLRPHDVKPRLKDSFTSTTRANPASLRVDSVVGSRAPHALFVDQGTGVHNPDGGGPYLAALLPPWKQGEGSLYEHTWKTGKGGTVRTVVIQGQKAQRFMEKGLNEAFRFFVRSGAQTKTGPRMARAMAFFPEQLVAQGTASTNQANGYLKDLPEWRAWRDEAFKRREELGAGQRRGRYRYKVQADRASRTRAEQTARENLAASREASDRRAREQEKKLADARRRKAAGEAKRREEKRRQNLADSRAAAVKFARALRQRGITSTGTYTTNPETGREAFAVTYSQGGVTRVKYF